MTTFPDTTSPSPSIPPRPAGRSGPTVTWPMSRIRIGVPLSLADTTMLSKSAIDFAYRGPRTMYSVPPNSISRPAVSRCRRAPARRRAVSRGRRLRSRFGSTFTWYCWVNRRARPDLDTPRTASGGTGGRSWYDRIRRGSAAERSTSAYLEHPPRPLASGPSFVANRAAAATARREVFQRPRARRVGVGPCSKIT